MSLNSMGHRMVPDVNLNVTIPAPKREEETMTIKVHALSEAELLATSGGDWDWGDFLDGLTYGLGVGCFWSGGNPFLCGGTLVAGGIGLYL